MPTIITGSGCFIPPVIKKNSDFEQQAFFDEQCNPIGNDTARIIRKFEQITGIAERRYASPGMSASTMAAMAATIAIEDAEVDPETIDQLIVAHNFGDLADGTRQPGLVPSLASRVKENLGIVNPLCVAYDLIFGCPGWLQGLIQADAFGKAGLAKRCLVIGTETLSRIIDLHDRDSMIFSDGAGAVVTEFRTTGDTGLLSAHAATFAGDMTGLIYIGESYHADQPLPGYIKMQGRKVYEFALTEVPAAMKICLEKGCIAISDVKKIFIHQANEKMDEAIVKRLYALYGMTDAPAGIMPMNIRMLGNSSVATIPTLFDMVRRGLIEGHTVAPGDVVIFASVGAGMNINAACYRM